MNAGFESFVGDIAIVRLYDEPVSDSEVLTSFNAITVPEPSSLAFVGMALIGCAYFARRRRMISNFTNLGEHAHQVHSKT